MAYSWTPLSEINYPETTHAADHVAIHSFLNQHIDTQFGQFDIQTVDVDGTYKIPSDWPVHYIHMTADTTFEFEPPNKQGQQKLVVLTGQYAPSFNSNVQWIGDPPTYSNYSVYEFITFDKGVTWHGSCKWQTASSSPQPPQIEYDILVSSTGNELADGTSLKNAIESAAGKTIAVQPGKYRIPSTVSIKSGQHIIGLGTTDADATIIDGSRIMTFANEGGGYSYTTVSSFQARDNIKISGNAVCEVSAVAGTNLCFDRDRLWFDNNQGVIVATKAEVLSNSSPYAYWLDRVGLKIYIKTTSKSMAIELDTVNMFSSDTGGFNDVTFENLVVQKFASPAQRGALGIGGNNNTIKNCEFRQNHALGVYANTATSLLVSDCYFYRNGQMGAGDYAPATNTTYSNNVWENCIFEENNTDDFYIGDWEAGGFKSTSKRGGVVKNCQSLNDKGLSYWIDFGSQWTIEDNVSTNAYAQGIRLEVAGNSIIRRNTITNSGHDMGVRYKQLHTAGWHGIFDTAAISIADSQQVECYENRIVDPNCNGIVVALRGRGSATKTNDRAFVHHNYIEQRQIPISINDGTGSNLGVFTAGGIGETGNSSTNLIADYYNDIAWSLPDGSGITTTKQNQFSDNTYVLRAGDTSTKRFVWFNSSSVASTHYKSPGDYAKSNPADTADITYV